MSCAAESTVDKANPQRSLEAIQPSAPDGPEVLQVVPVILSTIDAISYLRIHLPKDLRATASRETAWKAIKEIKRRWPKSIPLLDPIENMGIKDEAFLSLVKVSDYILCSTRTKP